MNISELRGSVVNGAKAVASQKDRVLAAVNGIIGDNISVFNSPLSYDMAYYENYKELDLSTIKNAKSKVCIFIHGNSDFEQTWFTNKNDFASKLEHLHDYTALYVRYNSGLHISTSGKNLMALLDDTLKEYPKKIKEIIIVGHSMGGLVVRSACHYGQVNKSKWLKKVSQIFFLGTPQEGALLAKFASITEKYTKKLIPVYGQLVSKLLSFRSEGLKDLSHAYLVDEDWLNGRSTKTQIPLAKHIEYFIIAATISKNSSGFLGSKFGDGMVHPKTALGLLADEIPEDHIRYIENLGHLGLTRDARVFDQIDLWMNN